jgi:tetrahydrodipicolinate N-succinyltransferase
MEFDIKNSLLKSTIHDNPLGKKDIKNQIGESLVSQTAQKYLEMNLQHSSKENLKNFKYNEKQKKQEKLLDQSSQKEARVKDDKIVRDPMKLLKLF